MQDNESPTATGDSETIGGFNTFRDIRPRVVYDDSGEHDLRKK